MPSDRTITRPYSKLDRLCGESKKRGGVLTTFAAVAKDIGVSPGRVSQVFSYTQEDGGTVLKTDGMLGAVAGAFTADGVYCEIGWFYLEFGDFAARIAAVEPPSAANSNAATTQWELRETTLLPDLVELRLHPPRAGNEVKDSYYVDATLLFGTALCDYDPEEGEEARTISIGLRNARLSIGSDSYRPLQGSMLGERVESDNFSRVAGGIEITGPIRDDVLHGDPIGDQHLAVITATNADDGPFAVTVAAHRRSFVVADADAPSRAPTGETGDEKVDNKNVILNHFIYRRCVKDEAGRAVVAQATMLRRCEDGDPGS